MQMSPHAICQQQQERIAGEAIAHPILIAAATADLAVLINRETHIQPTSRRSRERRLSGSEVLLLGGRSAFCRAKTL